MFLPFVTASLFKSLFKNPLHPLFGDLYYCELEWWSCVIDNLVCSNASRWTNPRPAIHLLFWSLQEKINTILWSSNHLLRVQDDKLKPSLRKYRHRPVNLEEYMILPPYNCWPHRIWNFFSSWLQRGEKKNINSLRHGLTINMLCKFTFYKL